MTPLPVIGPYWVTPGACQWVPISGVTRPGIAGQVTRAGDVSTGAARSEPSGHPSRAWWRERRDVWELGAGCGTGCTRGVRGARGDTRCAHHTRMDECIYGQAIRPG